MLTLAIADGVLTAEEHADLVWLCEQVRPGRPFFDGVTWDLQRLHGLMGGIAADGRITEDELRALRAWLLDHEHLKSCWPYDEVDALITSVLSDGKLDPKEHDALLDFFAEFTAFGEHRAPSREPNEYVTVTGVCAAQPEVTFTDRLFCFTGTSARAKKAELSALVESLGGKVSARVVEDLSYLVVNAGGNPCWAFACYGRKVEKAVQLRRAGLQLVIVQELDFWDAVREAGGVAPR